MDNLDTRGIMDEIYKSVYAIVVMLLVYLSLYPKHLDVYV